MSIRTHICCAALVALVVGGCAERSDPPVENVVLISVDTLRADALGCYGYHRPTSPSLAELCREAAVFDQAISHAPSTLPSHASLFTSLPPHKHGASFATRRSLPRLVVTLAEVLQGHGVRAAAFNGGGQLSPRWSLDQGFEVWASNPAGRDTFDHVVRQGLEWLDRERAPRAAFFLFLHSFEVHHPYSPSRQDLEAVGADPYDGWLGDAVEIRELNRINKGQATATVADLEFIRAAYDAEIRSMDRALGRLVEGLRRRELLESTLIVFTSDHGEEFGEHGRVGWHSHSLYDELLRVPLVVRFPRGRWAGARVQQQVRLIDVAPTIAEALGVGAPREWQGVSLVPLLRGREVPPLLAMSKIDGPDDRPVFSLRTERWKLYQGQLFDLARDPEERYDSSSGNLELFSELEARLAELTADPQRPSEPPVELDAETAKRLEALGYLESD